MSRKEKHWDDDWYITAPFIAFFIICVATGGIIGYKSSKIVGMIIGTVIGIVIGFKLTFLFAELFSLFSSEDEDKKSSQQHHQSSYSSGSGEKGNSQEWEKLADELLKIIADANNPYTILECRQEDDFETIKINYRRLVRQYHPDHLGPNASEAMHKYAKEMSQKINEAYEIIKKQRGIK